MSGARPRGRRDGGTDRGQAAIVAVVLLVGLVAIGSIGVLLVGSQANQEGQDRAESERVEQAFLELDRDVDSVARSGSGERAVDLALPTGADAAIREDVAGRIWINRTNFTTGRTDVLVDRSIGAIRYTDEGGTTYAFQAGGVWAETANRTRMVSAPAISYDVTAGDEHPTLTVPIVTTSGDRRLTDGEVRLEKNETVAPLNDVSVVENDLVSVTVQSRWYVGWAAFFEQMARGGSVTVDHANRTARMELIVPAVSPTVEAGVVAGTAAQTMTLEQCTTVDSYDSSTGPYDPSNPNDEGTVAAFGDVVLRQGARISGDLEVNGEVEFRQDSYVSGNLSYGSARTGGSGTACGGETVSDDDDLEAHVGGWTAKNASVEPRSEVDGLIDLQLGRAKDENDNASSPGVIDALESGADADDGCNPSCTLTAGTYLLEELHLFGGDKLVLDTSGGRVDLVVNGTMELSGDAGESAKLWVVGSERVNVYVNDETATSVVMRKVDVKTLDPAAYPSSTDFTNQSPKMWTYVDHDGQVEIKGGTDYTGVVYGPGGDEAGALIKMKADPEVYGALVGNVDSIKQDAAVHYDSGLTESRTVVANTAIPRLTFLHVAVHEVEVDDE